ncbi:MAG: secretin N-terminal domain-containing protein, partial [Burkholderiales bacterium]
DAARDALRPVLQENPEQAEALAMQRKIDEAIEREKSAGPSLTAKFRKPVTLEFRDASVKMVFEALSRASGVNVLLDKDVRPDLKTSIFVKDTSVEDTIDLIMLQNQLEKKILNDNTVFIYPNTPEKNKDYQDLKVRSFHLNNADPKVMLTMIKALLKTKDTFINEKTNSIVIRDTPEAIRLAEKMITDQDIPEPEVMMEVEVLEVSRNRLDQLGIKWPSTLTLQTTGTTLRDLRSQNQGTITASPAPGVTLDLMLQDADTNILASPRIRARNREKAKIMIGDRVPVITNAVTPVSTGLPVVTGSVQYLDVGLKLEVEPDIHLDNEVAIKIALEVSTLGNTVTNPISGTVAYQVSTRNASTLLQLKDGETQILAGLIDNEDRANASKIPGLGQLPIVGHLFADHGDNNTKTEIVLSITPHVVGRPRHSDARETEYWSGTEATLSENQMILKPIGASTTGSTAAIHPVVPPIAVPVPAAATLPPAATPVAATPPPLILSWQGPTQAKVGDLINLTLNTQSVLGMNNVGLMVNFDPAVFKAVNVVEGNIMQKSNIQSKLTQTINQASGQVEVNLAGRSANGATGEGSVVTLTLEAIGAASQSQITLSRIEPTHAGGRLAYSAPAPYAIAVSK